MQKKLIALAVAGLASSAAFAQSNVTISGTLRPSYDFVSIKDGGGNKTNSITNMNSNTSVIGFRGEEALGNGLKAIFGLTYNLDFTTENTGIGTDGGQDQYVGLAGTNWGSVKFGALNNALKNVFASYDPFSFSIGDYNNIFTQGVNSRNSKAAYYQSPSWGGFTLHGSYALEGVKDSKTNDDLSMYSIGGDYKLGGLQLTAAYSQGNNEVAGVNGADFKSSRFGAAYTFATKTKLFGVYGIDKDFKNQGAGGSYKTWMVGATHPITTNVDLMGTYIKAGDDDSNETGAKNYNLGVKYSLSKRTNVQGLYSYLKNDANSARGFDSGYDIAAGGKGSAFSVRLQHNF
ncbi:MAG TPA: porin [Rhodocyclaceae bacterium]|nr:porin [Rhodocyclaceae bacterium]